MISKILDNGKFCFTYDHPINETLKGAPFPVGEWSKLFLKIVTYLIFNAFVGLFLFQVHLFPYLITTRSFLGLFNTGENFLCSSTQILVANMKVPRFY